MRLDRVVGWHPSYTSNKVYFNHDPKLSKELIFTQANMMLGFYPPLQKQRLFYERQTNNIDQLFVESTAGGGNYAFTVCRSLEEKSRDNEITLWSLVNLDTTNANSQSVLTFKPPMKLVHSVSLSCGDEPEYLCLGGKDHQMRDAIIVYRFQDMVKFQKVEILARQLLDFDTCTVKFNPLLATSIVACGKENVKLFKIKNGHLPGQSVMLNNTARGKYFRHIAFQNSGMSGDQQQAAQGKSTYVFVATEDGLLYFINYHTRQVDKIIQIHEEGIAAMVLARTSEFIVSVSQNGTIRLWTTDFENLKSEVKTGTQISCCDVNYDGTQICVMSQQGGTISVLDLATSSYNVVLRTHLDHVTDMAHNLMTGKLVTLSEDYCVKVWQAETMEQINEFVSERDLPVRVVCQNQGFLGEGITSEHTDTLVAIGFKSGFLRVIDLENMAVVHETLLFQSPVMDIEFSLDNKFMAVFFKSGKIVIINKERPDHFQPVKNIDYELPNQNYCSLSFSMDSSMLANISSNANTITVWETRNFSLRYHLDVTGDIISKIAFAPNGRDLVLLTISSKLKFYRLGQSARDEELLHVKDSYDITDMECVDFQITTNNRFIICAGKEGVIKVYDYFMRGGPVASTQAFLGHFKHPTRLCVQKDLRNVYSCGEFNGIYKWTFYGDATKPEDLSQFCEELAGEKEARARLTEDDIEKQQVDEGMFGQQELQNYTQKQIDKHNN